MRAILAQRSLRNCAIGVRDAQSISTLRARRYTRCMRWSLLLVIAACRDGVTGDVDDRLIAMREGETVERRLVAPPSSRVGWPEWASVTSDGTLVLAPPCSAIHGTSGSPSVFELADADAGHALLVQVSPSLDGPCLPRVLACIEPD